MTTQEVAKRLHELCHENKSAQAHEELYDANATSTERNMAGQVETITGMDGITEKGQKFEAMIEEVFSGYTNEPTVFGNYIFMEMGMDVKMKGMDRMDMKEMCMYQVKDGKIISEQFYY